MIGLNSDDSAMVRGLHEPLLKLGILCLRLKIGEFKRISEYAKNVILSLSKAAWY